MEQKKSSAYYWQTFIQEKKFAIDQVTWTHKIKSKKTKNVQFDLNYTISKENVSTIEIARKHLVAASIEHNDFFMMRIQTPNDLLFNQ